MTRHRIIALSSIVLIASGGLIFACSGDDVSDGGTDAKADSTAKDGGTDAAKDGNVFGDSGQDATLQDSGTDATLSDATADVTTGDAADDAMDDAAADAMDDAAADAMDDASLDAGTATTFMVLRVGGDVDAGADASLSSASAQVYLEERMISDGSVVRTISLPTAMSGTNQPFTISGSSTSEGSLALSGDGHYVVIAGYATVPGLTSVSTSAAGDGGVLRAVARVDKTGAVDTTTELDAFSKKSPRGAVSNDGTAFWMTGAGNSGEGTQYAVLGSTGANTNIESMPTNTRVVQIFGGQLFISSGSSPSIGVSAVGTGLPTTTGQSAALLNGFAGDAGGSPYGFSMLDLDGSVAGLDTLYVADDTATTGAIQKWVFNGTSWAQIATFNNGATTHGFRGVTAFASGSNVIVLGTTGDGSPNMVVEFVDDGVNTNPTGTVLATAPTNTVFRGISLSPQ